MKLNSILNLNRAIKEIISQPVSYEASRAIVKITKAIDDDVKLTSDKCLELAKEFGEKSEDSFGEGYKIIKVVEYNAAINALLKTEIEIEIPKIEEALLKEFKMSPQSLLDFEGFINV